MTAPATDRVIVKFAEASCMLRARGRGRNREYLLELSGSSGGTLSIKPSGVHWTATWWIGAARISGPAKLTPQEAADGLTFEATELLTLINRGLRGQS